MTYQNVAVGPHRRRNALGRIVTGLLEWRPGRGKGHLGANSGPAGGLTGDIPAAGGGPEHSFGP